MVKIVTKTISAALILMFCSGALFAQREAPNFSKKISAVKQQTEKSVDRQNVSFANPRGEVIYSEGFENTSDFELPDGWVRFTDWDPLDPYDAEDYGIWIVVSNDVDINDPNDPDYEPGNVPGVYGFVLSHTGNKQLILSWWVSGGNCWAITSGFDLVAGYEYKVSFWIEMPGYPQWGEENEIKVTIGQTPTADEMEDATLVYQFEGMIVDYEEVTYTFIPETTGIYYLGFKDNTVDPYGEGYGIYIAIDDILITLESDDPDICDPVTNLEVEYTEDCEAVLTWEAPEGAELFNVYRDGELVAEVDETTFTDVEADAYIAHTWAVTVVCEIGESVEVTVEEDPCYVGISKQSGKVSIYPNPARSFVYIDGANIVKVEIYNMLGQLIDTQKGKVNSIDVSKYNIGTYLFKAYDVNNNTVITNITITR